jgi:lipoprotein NlpI
VAAANWLYVIYRHLGKDKKATNLLNSINDDMSLIENHSYHTILKIHQGKVDPAILRNEIIMGQSLNNTTLAFGLGNYYSIHGNEEKAQDLFKMIVNGNQWSAFGFITAEARIK